MKNSEYLVNDWAIEAFAIEKVNSLQQDILQTPDEAQNPSQALLQAYGKLTEQEKMAFILAGGVPFLFQCQQYHTQHMRIGSDTETGQLPVLC